MGELCVSELKDWPVLSAIKFSVECDFIDMVYVFGGKGKEVIFVTKDDNVYAFGTNNSGCLGLGHQSAAREPTTIDELCQRRIKYVVSGIYETETIFVLALTASGQTYAWGSNQFGTLGNGSVENCYKPRLILALNGVRVAQVACGSRHCLALTDSGEVFAWGFNGDGRVGNGDYVTPQMTPIRVQALAGQRVTAITCGGYHSLALTDTGVVYGWGYNGWGQLGVGNTLSQNVPTQVCLDSGVTVVRLCGGSSHALLLSSAGDVYAFGCNDRGQIGDGSGDGNQQLPIKVPVAARVADILALPYSSISMAITADSVCFIWGVTNISTPKLVAQKNFYESFNAVMNTRLTYRPVRSNRNPFRSAMTERLAKSFDDSAYSDIKFVVEGKTIYAQRLYLKSVCEHFNDMFSANNWLESYANEIEIGQYSYQVFHAFLKYLYTNEVEIRPEEAIDLLDLANSYFETELKRECERLIKNNVNVENVCAIFASALKYGSRELESYCVEFVADKMKHICLTDGFRAMDDSAAKKLIQLYFQSNS